MQLVFNQKAYVFKKGTLRASIAAAKTLAHKLLIEYDAEGGMAYAATIAPLSHEQASTLTSYRRWLWTLAECDDDHMTRIGALWQLASLLPNN